MNDEEERVNDKIKCINNILVCLRFEETQSVEAFAYAVQHASSKDLEIADSVNMWSPKKNDGFDWFNRYRIKPQMKQLSLQNLENIRNIAKAAHMYGNTPGEPGWFIGDAWYNTIIDLCNNLQDIKNNLEKR